MLGYLGQASPVSVPPSLFSSPREASSVPRSGASPWGEVDTLTVCLLVQVAEWCWGVNLLLWN